MSPLELLVFGSIAAAVLLWSAGEVLPSRGAWTAGALLALVHSIAAFGEFYGWSHETARVLTMQQTAALTGVQFAGGIYINYAFLLVWLGDAAWWWTSPASYAARPPLLSVAMRGFLFFIVINGAVIFADGWARVIGVLAVSAVILKLFKKSLGKSKGSLQHRTRFGAAGGTVSE